MDLFSKLVSFTVVGKNESSKAENKQCYVDVKFTWLKNISSLLLANVQVSIFIP
jgi:hypothetical protein